MKRYLRTAVYATALLLGGVSADAILSAATAQADVSISFDSFHDQLAQYGDWVYSDRWGEVWIPDDVSDDFHPYGTRGHWVDTDEYGWLWVSDYEWGDIPFHYGRWVNDPDDGWMWIPGYVWSPGWVVWRNTGQYIGWMPMPPDDQFLGRRPGSSIGISIGGLSISFNNTDDDYGYSRWYGRDYGRDRFASNWVFIGTQYIGARDYSRYRAPRNNYQTLINDSHNVTNYTVVNNYIVNRSIDPRAVREAGGHVQTVRASQVIRRPQFVARADTGSQLQARMRAERPHGSGFADSAPKPTAVQIQSLSTKAPRAHGGRPPAHLFTRETVTKAPLAPRPAAAPTPAEAPKGKPADKMPPAMERRFPGAGTPAPTTPAETPREKRMHDRMAPPADMATPAETPRERAHVQKPAAEMAPAATPAAEMPREKRMHDRMAPPADMTTPVKTPRERVHVEKPAAETAPAATPDAETPRVPRHAPKAEMPTERERPAAPVERPANVERPKPPAAVEKRAPAEPKEKKAHEPKHDEPGDPH
ncbi:MAG: hypothetical protein JSR81_06510 [Proteobacteria bacterium]|nr:hypothetical protein [Pseudomonadota bacterium]